MKYIDAIAFAIGIAGIAVIVWGVLLITKALLRLEYLHVRGINVCRDRDRLRHHLGSYLLMGLEFLVAADIIRTIARPTLNDLATLGAIVVIRILLSYFLHLETGSSHYCDGEQQNSSGRTL